MLERSRLYRLHDDPTRRTRPSDRRQRRNSDGISRSLDLHAYTRWPLAPVGHPAITHQGKRLTRRVSRLPSSLIGKRMSLPSNAFLADFFSVTPSTFELVKLLVLFDSDG